MNWQWFFDSFFGRSKDFVISLISFVPFDDCEHAAYEFGSDDVEDTHGMFPFFGFSFVIVLVFS